MDVVSKSIGDGYSSAEFNQSNNELENAITGTGITLSSGDLFQIGKAIANYVANGDFYTDSGAADAYVLSVIGSKQTLTDYGNGSSVRFIAGNTNTGASTVNVAALGVKNIFYQGAALTAGMLTAGDSVLLVYDTANSRFNLLSGDSLFMDLFTAQIIAGPKTFTGASIDIEGILNLGKDGAGNTVAAFYDDTNDTNRSLLWDDTLGAFRIEDSAGINRTIATLDATETFSNKTLNGPIINNPSSSGHVYGGDYTSTPTGTVNISDIGTVDGERFIRVGDIAHVTMRINTLQPTAGSTQTTLEVTLPIASDLGVGGDLTGSGTVIASGITSANPIWISPNVGTDKAAISFFSLSTGDHFLDVSFMYKII